MFFLQAEPQRGSNAHPPHCPSAVAPAAGKSYPLDDGESLGLKNSVGLAHEAMRPISISALPSSRSRRMSVRTVLMLTRRSADISSAVFQPAPAGLPSGISLSVSSAAHAPSKFSEVACDVEAPVDFLRLVELVGSIVEK